MNVMKLRALSVLAGLVFCGTAAAQAPVLNVKMGLWEVTSTTQMEGQVPGFDPSRLPPGQRASVEAMIKAMMAPHSATTKSCVTKETFGKSGFFSNSQEGGACKQTLLKNTRTELDSKLECTGEHPMKGTMHLEAPSPTTVKAAIEASTEQQGKQMKTHVTMTGKWLGTDCKGTK